MVGTTFAPVPEARTQTADMDTTAVPARASFQPLVAPSWAERLFLPFALYVAIGAAWMVSGAGGPKVTFYVGLISKLPAQVGCIFIVALTARRMAPGPLRSAWRSLAIALTLYFIADLHRLRLLAAGD